MTPNALAQRRRVLFSMLTTLSFRHPPGREPPVIAGIRQYLVGWPGIGRIVAGMARQQYDLRLVPSARAGRVGDLLLGAGTFSAGVRPSSALSCFRASS